MNDNEYVPVCESHEEIPSSCPTDNQIAELKNKLCEAKHKQDEAILKLHEATVGWLEAIVLFVKLSEDNSKRG